LALSFRSPSSRKVFSLVARAQLGCVVPDVASRPTSHDALCIQHELPFYQFKPRVPIIRSESGKHCTSTHHLNRVKTTVNLAISVLALATVLMYHEARAVATRRDVVTRQDDVVICDIMQVAPALTRKQRYIIEHLTAACCESGGTNYLPDCSRLLHPGSIRIRQGDEGVGNAQFNWMKPGMVER
jgi:hypothetical protein